MLSRLFQHYLKVTAFYQMNMAFDFHCNIYIYYLYVITKNMSI